MSTQANLHLEARLFCLSYELNLLSGQVFGTGLERWIEGFTPPPIHREHVQRYEYACRLTSGKRVLDIACGAGRGARMLAEVGGAGSVLGVDIDSDTVRYAGLRNPHARVVYEAADALEWTGAADFDVVVCFETIEHLPCPDRFLKHLASSLKPGGTLIISTPVSRKNVDDDHPRNPWHLREWGCRTFCGLLRERFVITGVCMQFTCPPIPRLAARIVSVARARLTPAFHRRNKSDVRPQIREFDPDTFFSGAADWPWRGYQIVTCSVP